MFSNVDVEKKTFKSTLEIDTMRVFTERRRKDSKCIDNIVTWFPFSKNNHCSSVFGIFDYCWSYDGENRKDKGSIWNVFKRRRGK